MELFSGYVVVAKKNTAVREVGEVWSCDQRIKSDLVIMLYHVYTAAREPNPQTLCANLDLDVGLPPPPEVVYKEHGKDLEYLRADPGNGPCHQEVLAEYTNNNNNSLEMLFSY